MSHSYSAGLAPVLPGHRFSIAGVAEIAARVHHSARKFAERIRIRRRERAMFDVLQSLNNRTLADIGIRRAAIDVVAYKVVRQPGSARGKSYR